MTGLGLARLVPDLAALAAPLADAWLAAVVRASLQGGLAVAAVWLLCRLVPRLPPALTAALWWAVCLKLVVALAWGWPVAGAAPGAPVESAAMGTEHGQGMTRGARGTAVPQAAAASPAERRALGVAGEVATSSSRSASRGALDAIAVDGPPDVQRDPVATARAGSWSTTSTVPREVGASGPTADLVAPLERLAHHAASTFAGLARLEPAVVAAVPATVRPALLAGWLLGLGIVLALSFDRRRRLRDALAAAEPVADRAPLDLVGRLAARLGVRAPRLLASDFVASPLVSGLWRPRIVVPRRALAGPPAELEMLLLHELVHLRRRDLALGLVPALAGRLLYFHPLAALAVREHLLAREAACDAEVVRRLDAAPRAYGRLLLRWGVVPPTARHAAAVAAHDRNHLKRRLLMLAESAPSRRSRAWLAAAAIPAAALLLPVRWVAETEGAPPAPPVGEAEAIQVDRTVSVSVDRVVRPPAVAAVRPVVAASSVALVAAPATAPAVAATPEARAVAAWAVRAAPEVASFAVAGAPEAPEAHAAGYAVQSGSSTTTVQVGWDDHGGGYAVLDEDGYSTFGGGYWSADRARELRRSPGEPLFLFRRDGQTWVVRDPELVARALDATRPMRELGERQGLLGGEQGELGGRQGELGGEQGKLGARQGEIGGEMGRLGGRLGALVAEKVRLETERSRPGGTADAATLARIAELRREIEGIESQMRALGERMRELGEQQRELGESQRALGESQRELGARQRALGMQQRELAGQAQKQLAALADRALSAGKAERVE